MPADGTNYFVSTSGGPNIVTQLSDSELVDRAQNATDRSAFEELLKRHQPALRYSLRQMCNWDEALADDLAQETFLQAFQKLATFRGDAKFSSWLYRIGYNTFLQYCRKKKLETEELALEPADDNTTNATTGENAGELHRALALAMGKLGLEARSVMHLILHQQCTQQEISDIMGIPLGSVKTHINRSRPILATQMSAWRT